LLFQPFNLLNVTELVFTESYYLRLIHGNFLRNNWVKISQQIIECCLKKLNQNITLKVSCFYARKSWFHNLHRFCLEGYVAFLDVSLMKISSISCFVSVCVCVCVCVCVWKREWVRACVCAWKRDRETVLSACKKQSGRPSNSYWLFSNAAFLAEFLGKHFQGSVKEFCSILAALIRLIFFKDFCLLQVLVRMH